MSTQDQAPQRITPENPPHWAQQLEDDIVDIAGTTAVDHLDTFRASVRKLIARHAPAVPPDGGALREAHIVAWKAAITLAHNVCTGRSDRARGNDELDKQHEAHDCAKSILKWMEPTPETLDEIAALTAANAEADRLREALDLAGSQLEASADDCLHEHALRIKYEDMLQRWRKAMEPAVTLNADGAVSLTFTADQYAQLCRVRDEVDGAALAARKGTTT